MNFKISRKSDNILCMSYGWLLFCMRRWDEEFGRGQKT
jgi:hypothetical protein